MSFVVIKGLFIGFEWFILIRLNCIKFTFTRISIPIYILMKKKTNSRKAIKKLIHNAGLALKNEFYLETSWIISTIIETRFKSIITRVEGKNPGNGYNLERCVKRVKYLMVKGDQPLLSREIGLPLVDAIRVWKNHRNKILNDMSEKHISKQRFATLAQEGIVLMQELNGSYKKFKSGWIKSIAPESHGQEVKTEDHEQNRNK